MKNPLERWSAAHRRLLVGVLAIAMLAIPATRVVQSDAAVMLRARDEAAALQPAWEVLQLIRLIQQHRGLANGVLSGAAALSNDRLRVRNDMLAALQRARQSIAELQTAPLQSQFEQMASTMEQLAAAVDTGSITPEDSFERHSHVIERGLDLVGDIAATFGITAHAERSGNFLQSAVLNYLPMATEGLARIRGEGTRLLTVGKVTPEERLSLAFERGRADREFQDAAEALQRSGLAVPGSVLANSAQNARRAATEAEERASRDVLGADRLTAPADEYFAAMTAAIDAQYALIGDAFVVLRGRIQSATLAVERRMVMEAGGIVLLAAFGGWLLVLVNRAQRRQEASDARSHAIIYAAPDAVLVCDRNGQVIKSNPAAQRLFGGDHVGASAGTLFPANEAGRIEAELRSLADGSAQARGVTRQVAGRRGDGTEFAGELICFAVGSGADRHTIAVVRDISERLRLEKQLRQSQKLEAVGQLTGGIAHDFNNLLGVIVGNLDLLESSVATQPPALKRVQTALKAALRGADLTRRLLAFSRRQHLEPARLHLADAIENVVEMASRTLGPQIRLVTSVADDTPDVLADAAALENALLNLLVNARDAMPDGGMIHIDAAAITADEHHPAVRAGDLVAGRYASMRVTDCGQGIPADRLEKVFEPFFTTKEAGKGTGLGLAMVYGFAKQSGGHVKIYSEVGVGTTVAILLPIASTGAASAAETSADTTLQRARPGATALVVDDEADLKEVAASYLQDMGFTVLTACDGPDALRVLESRGRIDLLVTDVLMPGGMNGVMLSQQVRQRQPGVRVVFTSGFPAEALAQRDQTRVNAPLVNKPFQRSEFARAVGHAMEGEAA